MSIQEQEWRYADRYGRLISRARFLPERAAQHDFWNCLLRSILQTAAFTAAEVISERIGDVADSTLPGSAQRLLKPSDGDLEQFISLAVPLLAETGVNVEWFSPNGSQPSLRDRVSDWCRYRNDRPGHGVVAADVREEALSWLPNLVEDLKTGLTPVLPTGRLNATSIIRMSQGRSDFEIELPTVISHEGMPVVIRDIRERGGNWILRAQALDPDVSPDLTVEFSESGLTSLVRDSTGRYRQIHLQLANGRQWRPTVLLPGRQTESFEGRADQVDELVEWLNDSDSRACNLHGDGGIGKTTLVLEVLNQLLDGRLEQVTWRPEIICFFSAKLTRWGPDGLIWLKGVAPPLDDAVRQLAAAYEEPNSREWQKLEGQGLISRVETLLGDLGVSRNQVLLVLDNTETLARSSDDEKRLGEEIANITKKLARVLITSRRRETMEARPIEVPPLNLDESMRLIVKLAKSYGANPIMQSGDPGRRKLVTALGGHPIKIDAACRFVGRFGYSLERARQTVLSNPDLGEFLYDDAWTRLESDQRLALVALAHFGDNLPDDLIHFVCSELSVDQNRVLNALEETKFAIRFDYAVQFDVRLEASALGFLASAYDRLTVDERAKVNEAVSSASSRQAALLRADETDVHDRVGEAFRTSAAKAAWQAASKGQVKDAVFWYEEAIKVEPGNAQLLERFAFYLASKVRDFDRAWLVAEEACRLNPGDPDAYFTSGHIAASKGDVRTADERLRSAQLLGFPSRRCALQQARARLRDLQNDIEARKSRPLDLTNRVERIGKLLQTASLPAVGNERDKKHQYEVGRVLKSIRFIAKRYGVRSP